MRTLTTYLPSDKMKELIDDNSLLLMVMSRFGIPLGFGDNTVAKTCDDNEVDCNTFLAVANFVSNKPSDCTHLSVASLMEYLRRAHSYFLEYNLPLIRRRLIEAVDYSGNNDVAMLILKFYDEYADEVHQHMEYENTAVFTYVANLLENRLSDSYSIVDFEERHHHIGPKLKELKDIIVRYYPEKDNNLLNTVLFDLINCEQDLTLHCRVEDSMFIPAVRQIEEMLHQNKKVCVECKSAACEKSEQLSEREREIIGCVAKGMTNKEIADALCLSIYTVMTHRRNIAAKLQIRSLAGLTIYAIANKIVTLEDIDLS